MQGRKNSFHENFFGLMIPGRNFPFQWKGISPTPLFHIKRKSLFSLGNAGVWRPLFFPFSLPPISVGWLWLAISLSPHLSSFSAAELEGLGLESPCYFFAQTCAMYQKLFQNEYGSFLLLAFFRLCIFRGGGEELARRKKTQPLSFLLSVLYFRLKYAMYNSKVRMMQPKDMLNCARLKGYGYDFWIRLFSHSTYTMKEKNRRHYVFIWLSMEKGFALVRIVGTIIITGFFSLFFFAMNCGGVPSASWECGGVHEASFPSYVTGMKTPFFHPAPCLSTTCSSRWQVVLYPSNRHRRETLEGVFPGGCIRLNLRHFLEIRRITFKPQTAMLPFWHCCLYTFSKTVLSCWLYLRLLPLLHSTRLKVEWGKGPHFPLLFPSFPSIPEGRHRRPWTCSIKGRGGAAQQDMKPALEEDIEGGGEKPPRETEEKERILIACKR